MEDFFIDLGVGFTLSRALPYLIMILLGLLLAIFVKRKLKGQKAWIVWFAFISVSATPFAVYFAVDPIFEGDFSNSYESKVRSAEMTDVKADGVYVISLPGCPYCKESVNVMRTLLKRNPKLEITYVVVSNEEVTLDYYKEVIGDATIKLKLADDPEEMAFVAKGSFPAYVLSNSKENTVKVWSNRNFGARALDEIEQIIQ